VDAVYRWAPEAVPRSAGQGRMPQPRIRRSGVLGKPTTAPREWSGMLRPIGRPDGHHVHRIASAAAGSATREHGS